MRIIFKSVKDFEKWAKSPTVRRKLNNVAYTCVITPRGIELVPVLATRHLHSVLIEIKTEEDMTECLNILQQLGFDVKDIPYAIVEPCA
jgi:hypothetical protein